METTQLVLIEKNLDKSINLLRISLIFMLNSMF